LGTVTSKADSDLAQMRANGVPSVFKVFNLLRVEEPKKKQSGVLEQSGRQGD
jgi:hypothetical protein